MIFFSTQLVASVSPLYAFEQSDGVGKAIVVFLFLASVVTWMIMLEKGVVLFRAKKSSEKFLNKFHHANNVFSLQGVEHDESPIARIYEVGVYQINQFYKERDRSDPLTAEELEAIRTVLEQAVSEQILELEHKIGYLATAVSVSPFFGLFGTVWGVMMAFCGVAQKGKADIGALAPGVSGALLTTVVGLVVAIPSLIGYNSLAVTIRKVTIYMDNFVEEFMSNLQLQQLDKK